MKNGRVFMLVYIVSMLPSVVAVTRAGDATCAHVLEQAAPTLATVTDASLDCDGHCWHRRIRLLLKGLQESPANPVLLRSLFSQLSHAPPAYRQDPISWITQNVLDEGLRKSLLESRLLPTIVGSKGDHHGQGPDEGDSDAWLLLGEVHRYLQEQDDAAVKRKAADFLNVCPEGLFLLGPAVLRLQGEPSLAAALPRARRLLESLENPVLSWYLLLWSQEMMQSSDAISRIERDMARLTKKPEPSRSSWRLVVEQGYRMLGDKESATRVAGLDRIYSPCRKRSIEQTVAEWRTMNPEPETVEERGKWLGAILERIGHLENRCSESLPLLKDHFELMAKNVNLVDKQRLVEVAQHLWTLWKKTGDSSGEPAPWLVARVLLRESIEPNLAEEILAEYADECERRSGGAVVLTGIGKSARSRLVDMANREREAVETAWAWSLCQQDKEARCREALAAVDVSAITRRQEGWPSWLDPKDVEGMYWSARARLAELDGAELDAAIYLVKAGSAAEGKKRWLSVGGSAEAWNLLQLDLGGNVEAALSGTEGRGEAQWRRVRKEIGDFSFLDIDGKRWDEKSLSGAPALVVFWASWCRPCLEELKQIPRLLALSEKEMPCLRVFLMNVDSLPPARRVAGIPNGVPVLLGYQFWAKRLGGSAIPLSWILDRSSKIRWERVGFRQDKDGDVWARRIVSLAKEFGECEAREDQSGTRRSKQRTPLPQYLQKERISP